MLNNIIMHKNPLFTFLFTRSTISFLGASLKVPFSGYKRVSNWVSLSNLGDNGNFLPFILKNPLFWFRLQIGFAHPLRFHFRFDTLFLLLSSKFLGSNVFLTVSMSLSLSFKNAGRGVLHLFDILCISIFLSWLFTGVTKCEMLLKTLVKISTIKNPQFVL